MSKNINTVCAIDENNIIAEGPVTKQPHTQPHRLVIKSNGSTLVVTFQYFKVTEETMKRTDDLYEQINDPTTTSYFENGHYFSMNQLHEATKRFAERLVNQVENISSIYRDAI